MTLLPGKYQVDIDSDNGSVPDGTEPLAEPMLTQIRVATCPHLATMSFDVVDPSVGMPLSNFSGGLIKLQ